MSNCIVTIDHAVKLKFLSLKGALMKFLYTGLFLLSYSIVHASGNAYTDAHHQLARHFKQEVDEKQKVKDARTVVLVTAAGSLKKGIKRADLKKVRENLSAALLKNKANETIITKLSAIEENHKRTFPLCCKPWIWQSTIDREAEELRLRIDEVLQSENPHLYSNIKSESRRTVISSASCAVAYPVSDPSAPTLNYRLLDQYGRNEK